MTFEELKTKMENLGFKYQPQSRGFGDSVIGLFYRRVPEVKRECLTNEGKLQLVVKLYDRACYENLRTQDFPDRYSFEADVTGEYVIDFWTNLRVCGLRPEVFFEKHKDIEASLVRAWEAMS
jgi:hypothetical protein